MLHEFVLVSLHIVEPPQGAATGKDAKAASEFELPPSTIFAALFDALGGAHEDCSNRVEVNGDFSDSTLHELHLGDFSPVLAQDALGFSCELFDALFE